MLAKAELCQPKKCAVKREGEEGTCWAFRRVQIGDIAVLTLTSSGDMVEEVFWSGDVREWISGIENEGRSFAVL